MKARRHMGGMLARADERARVAWRLGPVGAVRAAVRAGRNTRRQLGLVLEVDGSSPPPLPELGPLEPTDALGFDAFEQLLPETRPASVLEVLWYARFAAEGAETLLVARDCEGRPAFSTWLLDAAGQERHRDRFGEAFHRLRPDEVLLEGIFVFPPFRGRGLAGAGIAAACAWAGEQGATRVWCDPYLDNRAILPPLAGCGFEPSHVRVEVSSFGQVRSAQELVAPHDFAVWARATRQARGTLAPA